MNTDTALNAAALIINIIIEYSFIYISTNIQTFDILKYLDNNLFSSELISYIL